MNLGRKPIAPLVPELLAVEKKETKKLRNNRRTNVGTEHARTLPTPVFRFSWRRRPKILVHRIYDRVVRPDIAPVPRSVFARKAVVQLDSRPGGRRRSTRARRYGVLETRIHGRGEILPGTVYIG